MRKLELNAILAGLRLLQKMRSDGRLPDEIFELLEGDAPLTSGILTNEQIDELCQELNMPDLMVIAVGNPFDGLRLIGPFNGGDKAAEYADGAWHEGNSEPWHIVRLDEPTEEH